MICKDMYRMSTLHQVVKYHEQHVYIVTFLLYYRPVNLCSYKFSAEEFQRLMFLLL